jgi:UDP-glucose 4-epimerase
MSNKLKDSIVLVTGGAGFIGSYVIEELLSLQPKKIIVIDNLIRGSNANMINFINDSRVVFAGCILQR